MESELIDKVDVYFRRNQGRKGGATLVLESCLGKLGCLRSVLKTFKLGCLENLKGVHRNWAVGVFYLTDELGWLLRKEKIFGLDWRTSWIEMLKKKLSTYHSTR